MFFCQSEVDNMEGQPSGTRIRVRAEGSRTSTVSLVSASPGGQDPPVSTQ